MNKEQIISDDVMYKKMHETSLTNSFVYYNNIGICRHTIDVFYSSSLWSSNNKHPQLGLKIKPCLCHMKYKEIQYVDVTFPYINI